MRLPADATLIVVGAPPADAGCAPKMVAALVDAWRREDLPVVDVPGEGAPAGWRVRRRTARISSRRFRRHHARIARRSGRGQGRRARRCSDGLPRLHRPGRLLACRRWRRARGQAMGEPSSTRRRRSRRRRSPRRASGGTDNARADLARRKNESHFRGQRRALLVAVDGLARGRSKSSTRASTPAFRLSLSLLS